MSPVAVALALLLSASAVAEAPNVRLDTSLFETCLAIAAEPENADAKARLMAHPNVKKLERSWGERFSIDFDRIAEQRERVEAYREILPALVGHVGALADQAGEFLDDGDLPAGLPINVVCGGPFDAYGFEVDGRKELFLDLTLIDPDFLPHLMRHELWHIAFKARYPEMFEREYRSADDPLKRLAYQLLNEGVGHYYSLRRRVEPEIQYEDWEDRTQRVFVRLAEGTRELAGIDDREAQDEVIWKSHAGVPFWDKWGALSGAIIAYRLNRELGSDRVTEAVAAGPCGFLSSYEAVAEDHPTWERPPQALVDAACAKRSFAPE